jgi:hypothetical protein
MPKKLTEEEKRNRVSLIHGDKYDLSDVNWNLAVSENQRVMCKINDLAHANSKLFSKDNNKVAFIVSWNNFINKKSGCPVCAEKQRTISKTIDESEIKLRLFNHPNNKPETTLISKYTRRYDNHVFKCGICTNEFIRSVDDILRLDRNPHCATCQISKRNDSYRITMDEAQNRINSKFGENSIDICSEFIENMRVNLEFYCHKCDNIFTKTLQDLLASQGCIHCLPYGYSKKSIEYFNSLEIKTLQHAENGGEYRIPGSKYWADAWDPLTKTVYEFHGCDFHGHIIENPNCSKCKDPNGLNPYGIDYVKCYEKTQEKKQYAISLGYKYIDIWECEWDRSIL